VEEGTQVAGTATMSRSLSFTTAGRRITRNTTGAPLSLWVLRSSATERVFILSFSMFTHFLCKNSPKWMLYLESNICLFIRSLFHLPNYIRVSLPVAVAERSKAWTIFDRLEAVTANSNPALGMDVWCVSRVFCVCIVLCLGRGLATSWSPVQGVLSPVKDQEIEQSALCSNVGAN
jgi:hypothetical protein